ncbi:MAG: hypothetical protein ACUVR8_05505 [Acidobacteriota bacterium]
MMRTATLFQLDSHQTRRILGLWLWMAMFGVSVWADELVRSASTLPSGLSETERQTLQKETNPKNHLNACLKISLSRLTIAAEAVKQERYETAVQALRVYTGLLDYTHGYSQQMVKEKVRQQLLHKLEVSLRQQLPLLEWMVNSVPECHENCTRQALDRARTIRRQSLNAYFGGEFLKAGDRITE